MAGILSEQKQWVTWWNRSNSVLRPNFGHRPNSHKFASDDKR